MESICLFLIIFLYLIFLHHKLNNISDTLNNLSSKQLDFRVDMYKGITKIIRYLIK